MPLRRPIALAAVLFVVGASVEAGDAVPATSALAAKDAALIARLVDGLPPGERPVADVVKACGPSATPDERDLGFGVRRVDLALYGESLSAWVHLACHQDRVAALRISFSTGKDGVAAFRSAPRSRKEGATPYADHGDRSVEWADGARVAAMRAAVRAGVAVGDRDLSALPADARAALAVLDDVLASHAVGTMCSDDGAPPSGRDALEALVKAKAVAALESALASPSPEARVFAAEGLLRIRNDGASIGDDAASAIDVLRASPVLIITCDGCCFDRQTAKSILALTAAK